MQKDRARRVTAISFAVLLVVASAARAQAVCGDGTLDGGEACDEGGANGTPASCCTALCAFQIAGEECRPAVSPCDASESCTGSSAACPPDLVAPAGSVCRLPSGSCDLAEGCDGTTTVCPPDVIASAGTTCRAAVGPCDVTETCTGSSTACPADGFRPSGAECRPPLGTCDVAERCNGGSPICPSDVFVSAGTLCRPSVGTCDLTELCSGSDAACPPDALRAAGAECRPAAGSCDLPEQCDGSSTACPADALRPAGAECRAVAGGCDVADACTGSSAACPSNVVQPAGTVCRPSAGECDVAESCNGLSPSCPPEGFLPTGTVCRAATGVCDVGESCSGVSPTCPVDGLRSAGTVCRASAGVCDPAEACTGLDSPCPADVLVPAGTVCRVAAGPCDVDEACTGTTAVCPADVVIPDGTSCDDGRICTLSDGCSAGVCRGTVDVESCQDTFLCYRTKLGASGAHAGLVTLTDPFETRSFMRLAPKTLCTPADDNDGNGVVDAATHLVGYPIRNASPGFSPQIRYLVVNNWAGMLTVDTGRPDLMLIPAAKDLDGSPVPPAPGSHQVNHYKCYLAKTSRGTLKFQSNVLFVTLTDQFADARRITLKKPRHICFPVDVNGEEIVDPTPKLLCYAAKVRAGEPLHAATRTHVADEFGLLNMTTMREREICLPSRVDE